jgi:tight adherence protein B
MSELWIVCGIVFAGVVLGVQALYRLVSRAERDRSAINRRLASNAAGRAKIAAVDILRQERGLADFDHPRLVALNEFLAQTGLRISVAALGLRTALLCAGLALALSPFLPRLWIALGVGLIVGSLAVVIYLAIARRRRIDTFTAQLPDALNIIVRSLRIGHPFVSAISLAAKEMRDPIAVELAMTAEEIAFGQDVTTAVVNLHGRVGQDDLLFFVTAVSVQSQTGWFLSAMPFILYGAVRLLSKDYFGELTGSEALVPALIYAGVSLVFANLVIYRMVNFKI